jgi:hypothetical protein
MTEFAFQERPDSRTRTYGGDSPSGVLRYWCQGPTVEADVYAAAISRAPTVWDGLVRQTFQIDPQGLDFWYIDVSYGKRRPATYGDWKFTWDTTGGRQHITQSIETVHKVAIQGRTPTDHGGAIGVSSDSVDGCEIVVPAFQFSIIYYWDPSVLSMAYARITRSVTGKRNTAKFWGWAAGDVLFLGSVGNIEGNSAGTTPIQVEYRFAAEEGVTQTVAGMQVVKEANHYTWFEYQDKKDAASKRIAKRPVAAYTERVYRDADYSVLGLGNGG